MGYLTRFELTTSDRDGAKSRETCETCGHKSSVSHVENIIKINDGYSPFGDDTKWYNHHDQMIEYSKRFPDVVFTLSGEGEESDDIWKKYYKDGKSQTEYAEIQVAGFNVDKLEA
jgi:hypothetical protein